MRHRRAVQLAWVASIGLLAALLLPSLLSGPTLDHLAEDPAPLLASDPANRPENDPLDVLIAQSARLEAQLEARVAAAGAALALAIGDPSRVPGLLTAP